MDRPGFCYMHSCWHHRLQIIWTMQWSHVSPIHCPVSQRNSLGLQSGHPNSSLASGQSFCPSHRQTFGMQSLLEPAGAVHVKWSSPHAGSALHVRPSSCSTKPCGQEQVTGMEFDPLVKGDGLTMHRWEQPPWRPSVLQPCFEYICNKAQQVFVITVNLVFCNTISQPLPHGSTRIQELTAHKIVHYRYTVHVCGYTCSYNFVCFNSLVTWHSLHFTEKFTRLTLCMWRAYDN